MPTDKTTRRQFLSDVGCGVLVASVGATMATELGLSKSLAAEPGNSLTFGAMESLVALMQETPVSKLLPLLTEKLNSGTELRTLVAAAALANARTFGGEDYVGFHTLMAIAPAWHMSRELPSSQQALPVFKVIYRNTNRIQEFGGRTNEVLHPVAATATQANLREAIHAKDVNKAEGAFSKKFTESEAAAFNALLEAVGETTEVHRTVLPYRAWDLLDIIGHDHAHTLLRQSVRYCVKAENWGRNKEYDEPRT